MFDSIYTWLDIGIVLVLALACYFACKKRALYPLNMLQLNGYESEAYQVWMEENPDKTRRLVYTKGEEKTPLVMTERATRLYKTHKWVTLALVAGTFVLKLALVPLGLISSILAVFILFGIYFYQYWILLISNAINYPQEVKVNLGFYRQAQDKIRTLKDQADLRVVGITGSFGKTSTKFITADILQEAFQVQTTPSSYNTPMGLSKVINNDLDMSKRVFMAELGADRPGEIAEVADLVQPEIGIITAIGPTHMQNFKTIENIQKTKFELIESLPDSGVAIFNHDNAYVRELIGKREIKTLVYGLEEIEDMDTYAKDIRVGARGSSFVLGIKGLGEVECQTRLLGRHNISNLLAGASVAGLLGMGLDEIKAGISQVQPVDHRLSLIDSPAGTIVIDDTFNSNPVGARAALDVLGQFEEGQKIIVTPGMVELGEMEKEENFKLGQEIAKVVDYAILVGAKRTAPIKKGLEEAGFSEDRTLVVDSLDEATVMIGQVTQPGDVILFENDLPDSYSEV